MASSSPGLELFHRSHETLLAKFLEFERQNLPPDVAERQLMEAADVLIREYDTSALLSGTSRLDSDHRKEFRDSVRGLLGGGSLVPLLDREDVENIHILGHDNVILSLADGRRIPSAPLARNEEELVMMIRHLAATAGHTSRRFDTASPILDLRLASGHRLFAVTAVAEQTSVVIRRHRMLNASMERLLQTGTVSEEMVAVLQAAVRPPNPANMLVVGGTGAGKTTLLRSLLSEVPQSELIVTIEDTLELHLKSSGLHERTLALETRTSNTEGTGEITMYDLCKAALRMSPDRVMVGEVRGGEVMQLLQAMGIGNDGSMGTIHAGSTRAAINKILIYAQRSPDAPTPDSVLREVSEVLHLLVYIKKLPDGRRAITSILEVTGFSDGGVVTSEVFAPGPDGIGVYVRPFNEDGETLARLRASGFDPDDLGEPYDRSRTLFAAPDASSAPASDSSENDTADDPAVAEPAVASAHAQPERPAPAAAKPAPAEPEPQPAVARLKAAPAPSEPTEADPVAEPAPAAAHLTPADDPDKLKEAAYAAFAEATGRPLKSAALLQAQPRLAPPGTSADPERRAPAASVEGSESWRPDAADDAKTSNGSKNGSAKSARRLKSADANNGQ